MASLLNRLAKIEQKRKTRTNLQPIAIVIGDEHQRLEDLQQRWLVDNQSSAGIDDISWIYFCLIGADT